MIDEFVAAVIRGAHGVGGEVKITCESGDRENLAALKNAVIRFGAARRPITVEYVRGQIPNLIMKIEGLDTREDAGTLTGGEILVPRGMASPLGDGEYYAADLQGMKIVFEGETVGTVRSVWDSAASSMLEVELPGGTAVHVPFLNRFFGTVNTENGEIELLVRWILE